MRYLVFILIVLFWNGNSFSQSAANYTPIRSTGITFSTILGSGTAIASWRYGGNDDDRSNTIAIGFDFWYLGTKYTTISVSTNGYIDFSSSSADGSGSGAFGYENSTFYGTSSTKLCLAPLYDDLAVSSRTSNTSIAYSTTGAAPNRIFTVEWEATQMDLSGSYKFQVKLNESTGVIEYWYGTNSTDLVSYNCGLNGATVSATPLASEYLNQTTANTSTFGVTEGTLTTVPTSNSKIVFTSPTTSAPTSLTFSGVTSSGMTLNWTNNGSNRVVSAIYKSTDDVTYTYVGTAASGATSYAASGLTASTTYYWKVYSVSEGYVSSALSGSQATSAAPTAYVWDGGGGDNVWTTATNWDADIIPSSASDVTFNTAGTFTVTSVPTLSINSLTMSNGTVTFSGSTTTLTIGGNAGTDLTIASSKGLTLNGVSVTLANSATADISGTFTITTGTFNTNGTSVVTTVSTTGSISNAGTVTCTSTAKLIFEGSSTYTHAQNGGTIPTADWNGATNTATSTCTVSGMTSTKPGGLITTSNTFYHFTWNCASQSASLIDGAQGSIAASGENFTCLGNFTISNSGSGIIAFSDVSGGALSTLTIGGNMVLNSSYDNFILNYWSTPVTVNITGDLNVSGGHLDGKETTSGATTIINVTGNVNVSGGEFHLNVDGYSDVTLNVTGNLNVSGGDFVGTYGAGSPTVNVTGNLSVSSGIFYGTISSGAPTFNITGNLAVSGTGTFLASDDAGDPVYNITGSLTTSGGSTTFYGNDYDATGNPVMNIQGSVDLSTGTVGATDGTPTSNSPVITFNLTGAASNNLTLKTGLTYNAGAPWSWNISAGRTITLLSNIEIGGTASSCIFTNNGTLIMGTYTFPAVTSAAASFVNASGATLKTACLTGLQPIGTGTGAVLVTGTRTYNSGASYVFNGAAAQITGIFASTVANLEFNNSSGVTLSQGITVSNSGILTLTAGYHNLGTYTLQLGTSAANTLTYTAGGLYSSTNNGSFKRWIPAGTVTSTSGNYYGLFPFKKSATNTNKLELNSTADVTTGGFITATAGFTNTLTDVADYADDNATVQKIHSGKGITLTLTTIAGGTFGIKMTGGDYTGGTLSDYTLVTYTGASPSYQTTFAATTGTTTNPIVARTGVSTANLAQTWVIGTYNFGVTTLPVELISFDGKKDGKNNMLFWNTASEVNNDFFTIEKTTDGENFEIVGTENGAGNSTQYLEYLLTDYNVREVINYYRLKQTDFDGKYTFSDVISIDNRTNTSDKEIVLVTNILGQEVNEHYRGVVIVLYADGTSIKVIQ